MSGMFDPDSFMSGTVEGGNSTEYTPIPEGEYNAVIEKAEARTTPKGTPLIEVNFKLDAPGVADADGRSARYTVWLDVTESGSLDMGKGKNVALGRLREAVKQNGPGAWNPGMLLGAVARVNIKHRVADDGATYADVKGIAKAA